MGRKPRIHFPGAFYHVMLRGNDRQNIFFSDQDKKYFYSLIQESINQYNYRVHGFCLMSNHVHLALQVGELPLSKIMQNISMRYTRYINSLQNRVGHLFQGRFKAILVDADEYLLSLIRYIHQNPVRSNIVVMPETYTWSSYKAYLNFEKIPWLTTELVLSYFNTNTISAHQRFINFMKDSDDRNNKKFMVGNSSNHAILGEDKFFEQLQNEKLIQKNPSITIEQIEDIICFYYSIDEKMLQTKSRSFELSKIRTIIAWLAREFDVCTVNHVGKYFHRDPTGLIRNMRKLEKNLLPELTNFKQIILKSFCQA